MDVQMPVMDGVTTTENIRKKLMNNIPVIGCSAHSLSSEKIACLNAGMNDYITKPFTETDLVNAVVRNFKLNRISKEQEIKKSASEPIFEEIFRAYSELENEVGLRVSRILISEMLKRLPGDLEHISLYEQAGESEKLRSLAHNLSGSLSALKLKKGHILAESLEKACRDPSSEHILQNLASRLSSCLREILEASREYVR
jgi:CheY-like chemotaxis protein